MATITFNAFSFLQKKLKAKNMQYVNAQLSIGPGTTARKLIHQMQLTEQEVEVVMINGKAGCLDTILENQDRVAFVPHGTPGPYRVLLGFKNTANS
ncbi:MAG: MoaD/ThiS family protein [Proteobacteria bacterium]|nr:MoaD/ThiS family protein [Desulfobacula sp.]MBU3952387.1 MoaD/ThiS family protein [Pseudomonadota bacterium]MBU4131704.1 MoaD/ThiS family protein [Pseudomonadota bacterium]